MNAPTTSKELAEEITQRWRDAGHAAVCSPNRVARAATRLGVGRKVGPIYVFTRAEAAIVIARLRPARGGARKLTEKIVRAIRRRAARGDDLAAIATDVGVSHKTVWDVVNRETWAWVEA